MANFKLAKKDSISDNRSTIYELHNKKMEYFDLEKKNIQKYIDLLEKCKNDKDKTTELKEKINNITDDIDRNQYLLDFIEIFNNKNKCSIKSEKGDMDLFVSSVFNDNKSELYNEYIKKFNPELKSININKVDSRVCPNCNGSDIQSDYYLATELCTNCGLCISNIIGGDESHPVYTDCCEQITIFNYKRTNHFQECLNQLQAKENTTIPKKIIEELSKEFRKYNITDPKMITPSLVKEYLKKLKYSKYYEHIPTIINEFCGLDAPKLTPELEQQLKIMFDEIQSPFEKYSKNICPNRKNFLNYNYVFYKMCELLNKDEFLSCFPLLKSREKIYEHDLIWKGICTELKWEFIPSI